MDRFAVVTPVFPNSADPYRGIFNLHTVEALQRWADVKVYCTMAGYPKGFVRPLSRSYGRVDISYTIPGVNVQYVEYPAYPVISRPFNAYACARHLLPLLKKDPPDLILAFWVYPAGLAAVMSARKLGIPAVVKALGSDLRVIKDPFTYWGVRRALREADSVVTVSDDLRHRAIALGAAPEKVHKILNGCDSSIFRLRDRAEARAVLGVDTETQLVVFVGRVTVAKGIVDLMQAVGLLVASHPRLRLVCIGEDVLGDGARAVAADPRLAGRVQFAGLRPPEQIAQWCAAANIFCLPSHSEGSPNALIEAFHCGRAAVATSVGGIPEIADSRCAILVPPHNPKELAAGLAEALARDWNEPEIAARFSRGWDDVGRETFETCQALLQRK